MCTRLKFDAVRICIVSSLHIETRSERWRTGRVVSADRMEGGADSADALACTVEIFFAEDELASGSCAVATNG